MISTKTASAISLVTFALGIGGTLLLQPYIQTFTTNVQPGQALAASPIDDAAMKAWVTANAGFIYEEVDKHLASRQAPQKQQNLATFQQAHEKLFDSKSPTMGATGGNVKIRIAHFFDYNCGYCKEVHPVLKEILKKNPDVQITFHDYPILRASSRLAAQAGVAAHLQGKYASYHDKLYDLAKNSSFDEDKLIGAAEEIGLDIAKFTADMKSETTVATVTADYNLANGLGISGTPFFYVEGAPQLVPGYADYSRFEAIIKSARQAKSSRS